MKRIAIVDDEQDILNVLNNYLSRSGKLDINTYSNPKTALMNIKNGNYDLVVLDIMMPDMNGVDVLKEIKASKPSVKVLMMTAFSTVNKTIECHKIGAEDYVTKPFVSLRDVENRIFNLLGI